MRNNNGKKSNKLKQSLLHTIRKTFEKQQDKTLSHKEVCDLVDAREGALRTLVFSVLKDLASEGFLKAMSYDTFKMNSQEKLILEGSISVAAKGFGFVTFQTSLDAQKALLDKNIIIDGRSIYCDLAVNGKYSRPPNKHNKHNY